VAIDLKSRKCYKEQQFELVGSYFLSREQHNYSISPQNEIGKFIVKSIFLRYNDIQSSIKKRMIMIVKSKY